MGGEMREIIFRGKRVDAKEWVYGYLYKEGSQSFILKGGRHYPDVVYGQSPLGILDWCEVIPETVGQFTGLTDKNGVKIFEGDILRFPAKDEYEKTTFVGYEVFYHDNDCADKHIGFQMNRMCFYGHLCGGECRAKLLPKYTSQMVIIGNIHDQKEDV